MPLLAFPLAYVVWHYTFALPQIFLVWKNIFWYVIHLFSIGVLLRTLLSPWKRITEPVTGTGLEDIFSALAINLLSRIVGLTIRIPIILIGLVTAALAAVGLVVFYVFWLLVPLILISLCGYGLAFFYV